MKILWCITGGGHGLKECVEYFKKIAGTHNISVAFSRAGIEVCRIYGLLEEIKGMSKEVIIENENKASFPFSCCVKRFEKIIVAPATANTISKIRYGIADSLITNIVAQAVKNRVEVYVLPTDFKKEVETVLPITVEIELCRGCEECIPQKICEQRAIERRESGEYKGKMKVILELCNGCRRCVSVCYYGALKFGKKLKLYPRVIDIENVNAIAEEGRVVVLHNIEKLNL